MVAIHKHGFSPQQVALTRRLYKHDIIRDTKGEQSLIIHECGYGKVSQCKECPTLAHAPTVQVLISYYHLSHGVMLIGFCQLTTCIPCKVIGLIQQLFNVHSRIRLLQLQK